MEPIDEMLGVPATLLPGDHARQIHVVDALRDYVRAAGTPLILDLGCGDGRALDIVRENAAAVYNGVDIDDSPEVRSRVRADGDFQVFDGVNLPFPADHFDCVYSCSVLEHVRRPDALMAEVRRVLKPGGRLIGSVSYLEPYHSRSIFNFTPYGLMTVLGEAGIALDWLRPGIDGFTLTARAVSGRRWRFNKWFHAESPGNRLARYAARRRRRSVAEENAMKIRMCGHLVFAATKPAAPAAVAV